MVRIGATKSESATRPEILWESVITCLWVLPLAWLLLKTVFPPVLPLSATILLLVVALIGACATLFMPDRFLVVSPDASRRVWRRRLGVRVFGRIVVHGRYWNRWIP